MRKAIGFAATVWGLIGLLLLGSMFVPGAGVMQACKRYDNIKMTENDPMVIDQFETCRIFIARNRARARQLAERYEQQ